MTKTNTQVATRDDEATNANEAVPPVLVVAVGRQRVGKTTLLNALAEVYRANGAKLAIWNADLHNRTHTLSLFHNDVMEPSPELSAIQQQQWIEERVRDQVTQRFDAVLDVGGGITALNALVEEIRLVDMLEQRGIRVVLLYVLGNERADLDYLARLADGDQFMPESTIIAFNEGLLGNGANGPLAFAKLMDERAVKTAIKRGAEIVRIPSLSCMSAVTDRGMSFTDFAKGKQVEGSAETSFFDQARVDIWLNKAIVKFFAGLPPHWMPALPKPLKTEG
jgi:hypothetical protein